MGRHTSPDSSAPSRTPRPPRERGRHLRWPALLLGALLLAGLVTVAPSGTPADGATTSAAAARAAARCSDWSSCARTAARTAGVVLTAGRVRPPTPTTTAPTTTPPRTTAPVSSTPTTAPAPASTTSTTAGTTTTGTTTTGTATATGTASGPLTAVSYAASDEVVANPERGFTHYTESRWSPDGSAHTPLDVTTLRTWRTAEAVTVVYRVYYLGGLVDRDTIDQRFLDQVAADLATARAAGVKLVVRFAYSPDDGRDAPPARAVGHVRQLAPVLNAASDVVLVLQAGFVGRWGEWYYSDSYASDPARPWALTDADWARRGQVLDALLDATSPDIWVQVRYPSIVSRLVDDADARRVGVHNDCFLASDTDMGTFATAEERTWLAAASARVPVGGETCGTNGTRSQWSTAATELARYHWSFLNADFHRGVLDSWGQAGLGTAARSLGYRLRLVSGAFPATARPGQTVQVELTLANDGYAAPLSDRPVRLVFGSGPQAVGVPVAVDVRSLAPGTTRTFRVDVPVPTTAGAWPLALALPDDAPSLAGDPAYAVRLANQGLWDPATGRNDLRHTLTVG
ncbi:protein of unknown function [Geodermatophilus saharensis]|uniref:DUF4832 domain-containing protein n=1 Tax=Geodermatophilus saharensis TaxID=1137994 RepID=A0A239IBD1_9ACTN|nr:DUF4832 domain-containing protein [Geodermatophilus saharensis]SNS90867.1 protein of unknown function [Geodermatophilus saharensis]